MYNSKLSFAENMQIATSLTDKMIVWLHTNTQGPDHHNVTGYNETEATEAVDMLYPGGVESFILRYAPEYKTVSTKKVFLGGTCNGSTWRNELIPQLQLNYFNPVVPVWTAEAKAEEIRQREICDVCLYVITPEMSGVYSIAEAVADSIKQPGKTVFAFFNSTALFTEGLIDSLMMTGRMIESHGAKFFTSKAELVNYLNNLS